MTKKKAKPLDPKGIPGAAKVQLHLVPPSAIQAAARAFEQGAVKYGAFNWRESDKVNASTYISAALRHIQAYQDGENMVPDNLPAHHLGAAIASLAVIIDSLAAGTLRDDRPKALPPLGYLEHYYVPKGEVYGVSPAAGILKDIKEANARRRKALTGIVYPPKVKRKR